MIKILFFIERLSLNGSIGGAERVLCTLLNHLDKSKYEITLRTVFPDDAAHMVPKSVDYRPIFDKETSFNKLMYRIETEMGLTYPLHLKDQYDLEIAYLEYGPTKVISYSTNKSSKRLAWVHCDFETAIKDKIQFKNKSKKYYKNMDHVVCVSEKSKNSFLSIFGDVTDSSVLYNVVDDREIKEKAKLELPEVFKKKRLTLLMVGRLSAEKNYLRMLRTVNKLKDEGFEFDLWIVGEGAQREQIENYILENHLADIVTLCGFQKNPYPFMREADLLVCSSDFEGYSTFVTEGIILGKPIYTTDCSGMHELLGDSEYGVIVANNDDAFYEGLRKMLTNVDYELLELRKKVAKRSNDFKLEKLVKETEDFFDSILQE